MSKKSLWLIVLVLLVLGGEEVINADNEEVFSTVVPRIFQEEAREPLIQKTLFPVLRVIDGDTIEVNSNGVSEKVRLIGVNTPETVDPRRKVECFGIEASRFVAGILAGTSVSLEADASQGDRDRYGRLLRYVYLPDGTLFNRVIIAEGYGYEYTYNIPYRYMNEFKDTERTAQKLEKGLWAEGVCG
jgi:micrococcal nuclease